MNFLLVPVGSYGDVHPFLGLGSALLQRGHRVTMITNGHFRELACGVGLEFVEVSSAEDYRRVTENPDLWHPRKALRMIVEHSIVLGMRQSYQIIAERYVPGQTVVAAAGLAFGARIAHEKLGVSLATIHLQPLALLSTYRTPVIPGFFLPGPTPRWLKRLCFWASDLLILDRVVAPMTNAFRAELGLRPVRHLLTQWWHSPQRIIGLFPDWFGPPQPDWPPQTRLTGFFLYDERDSNDLPAPVADFLAAGEPPILFTPGSAMRYGLQFFEAAAQACSRLGRRGILLTRYPEQLPTRLPDGVRHFEYIPFSTILPRAAALVHHGGIGTTAQALAAGVPQLITPFAYDQPDNADRLKRLGVGLSLSPRAFRGPALTTKLDRLLGSPDIADTCRDLANRFGNLDPITETCVLLEELA